MSSSIDRNQQEHFDTLIAISKADERISYLRSVIDQVINAELDKPFEVKATGRRGVVKFSDTKAPQANKTDKEFLIGNMFDQLIEGLGAQIKKRSELAAASPINKKEMDAVDKAIDKKIENYIAYAKKNVLKGENKNRYFSDPKIKENIKNVVLAYGQALHKAPVMTTAPKLTSSAAQKSMQALPSEQEVKVNDLIKDYKGKLAEMYKTKKISGEKKHHTSGMLNSFRNKFKNQDKRNGQIAKIEHALKHASNIMNSNEPDAVKALSIIKHASEDVKKEIKKENPFLKSRLSDIATSIINKAEVVKPSAQNKM